MPAEPPLALGAFLQAEGLSHLYEKLEEHTLSSLAPLLTANRVEFLGWLKDLGVSKLGDRQRLANGLTKAIKEGRVDVVKPIPHLIPSTWTQNHETLTIKMLVRGGTPTAQIAVRFDVNSLAVTVNNEKTSVIGRLFATIKPIDSTWEMERAPPPELTLYESEASRELADDTVVIVLVKARPAEWTSLFHAGSGISRKEAAPEPPKPKAKPRPSEPVSSPMEFRPRKLRLGAEKDAYDARRAQRKADAEDPIADSGPSLPAKDYWQPELARFVWRKHLDELHGVPDGPSGVEPFFRWSETEKKVVLRASTRRGLPQSAVDLSVRPAALELLVDGAATPWTGSLCGRVEPAACHATVLPQPGEDHDLLELTLAKADARLWRAPFKDLLPQVAEQDRRRQLPLREVVMFNGYSHSQHGDCWELIFPIKWKVITSGQIAIDDFRVAVTPDAINVHISGQEERPLLAGELWGTIIPESCKWRMEPPKRKGSEQGELMVLLKKDTVNAGAFGSWRDLIKTAYV